MLKPNGSAVFILGPNSERIGKMRLWLWEFVAWAGREWNLVQDCYWWAIDAMPLGGIKRHQGLMRRLGEDVRVAGAAGLLPESGCRSDDAI